ncbi:MAG: hypothetical protein JWP27_1738 [Flaviaesturariibacter sp.]|nr:hypothetical protein [Flaviaesturariibacter sp.]
MPQPGTIIYNVTIKVDPSIADAWRTWLLSEHIPGIMGTGCFSDYRVVRLLETDESDGPTFAVQYTAADAAEYARYIAEHADYFRQDSTNRWGANFIAFRSVMEVVA